MCEYCKEKNLLIEGFILIKDKYLPVFKSKEKFIISVPSKYWDDVDKFCSARDNFGYFICDKLLEDANGKT